MSGMTRLPGRMGVPGLLGAAMLGTAVWTVASWLPAQQALTDELGSQSRRLRHELREKTAAGAATELVAGPPTPQRAWQALWQGLPDAGRRVAMQSDVLAAAERSGVRIASVQYRGAPQAWSAASGQSLWRQRMVMPIEGRYPAIRAWMARLLQEPALAIDALDIERGDTGSDEVKGRISLSLYWRQAGGGQP